MMAGLAIYLKGTKMSDPYTHTTHVIVMCNGGDWLTFRVLLFSSYSPFKFLLAIIGVSIKRRLRER